MAHEHGHDGDELPAGVAALTALPNAAAGADWERMILADGVKERLVNWAVLALEHGSRLSLDGGGLQRLLVFAGPPGTGKSTTGRGLANTAVTTVGRRDGLLIEVDPHALPSDMLGQSQRNVTKLMQHTIPALISDGQPAVVLVDEVEAFAVSRVAASFDTNPADLHRATDAVLAGLDRIAREFPSILILATTNFPTAVDEAIRSRADWVVPFTHPDAAAARAILRDALLRLAAHWPSIASLAEDEALLDGLAKRLQGTEGRLLAKVATLALTLRTEVARDPSRLMADDLADAADLLVAGEGA